MFQNALIVKMNENVCHDTALMLESLDDVIKYMLECNYNIFTKNHDVFIIYFEEGRLYSVYDVDPILVR